jgi:hypothetical protein
LPDVERSIDACVSLALKSAALAPIRKPVTSQLTRSPVLPRPSLISARWLIRKSLHLELEVA